MKAFKVVPCGAQCRGAFARLACHSHGKSHHVTEAPVSCERVREVVNDCLFHQILAVVLLSPPPQAHASNDRKYGGGLGVGHAQE
jgi:hypothetical protein